jgi:hypothetical protein
MFRIILETIHTYTACGKHKYKKCKNYKIVNRSREHHLI